LTNIPAAIDGSTLADASGAVATVLGDDFEVLHAAIASASAQTAASGRLRITP
jgi:hypothetical protein